MMANTNGYAFLANGVFSTYSNSVYSNIASIAIANNTNDFTLSLPNTEQKTSGSYVLNANGSWIQISTSASNTFSVGTSTYFVANGNVGIGTSSPSYKLHVVGNIYANNSFLGNSSDSVSAPSFSWAGDTTTGIYHASSNAIGFSTAGVQRALIDSTGNFYFNSGYGSAAVAYGCRAWVNFDGSLTAPSATIRASGGVSSVVKNLSGVFTVNFSTAMPDANYSVTGMAGTSENNNLNFSLGQITYSTSSFRFQISDGTTNSFSNPTYVDVQFFR